MKRKLLFVVNVDWFFISHRLPIAVKAREDGYEVHLATELTGHLDFLISNGIVVHNLKSGRGNNLISILRFYIEIQSLFKSLRPDLVHLVTIKPVILGGLAARISKIPGVVSAISGLGFVFLAKGAFASLRRALVGKLYKFVLSHKNIKIIFQNKDDMEDIKQISSLPLIDSVLIKGSGVSLKKFKNQPVDDEIPIILMASRLLVDKGVLDFIEAARIIKKQAIPSRFVLVGDPDFDNPASIDTNFLSNLNKNSDIEYWGHQEKMHEVLAASTIVVLPSYREGLPKVLIEASASSRAVITTDVPGCRDAIIPGVTGLLVRPQDPVDLAHNIKVLLEDPLKRFNMGEAGRKMAEKVFDENIIISQHIKIYKDLLIQIDS